jgi:hypothetical protein
MWRSPGCQVGSGRLNLNNNAALHNTAPFPDGTENRAEILHGMIPHRGQLPAINHAGVQDASTLALLARRDK